MKGGKVESGTAQRNEVATTRGSSGGQSSVDAWEHAKPEGKWTEVSADCRVLDALVKEGTYVDEELQRQRKEKSRPVRYA